MAEGNAGRLKNPRKPKILFFLAGMVPTPDEKAEAEAIGKPVAFRNASMIHDGDRIEPCDMVAGLVPEQYVSIPHAEPATPSETAPETAALPSPPPWPNVGAATPPAPVETPPRGRAGRQAAKTSQPNPDPKGWGNTR